MIEDVSSAKSQFNLKVEDFMNLLSRVQVDNSTTRALLKHQTEDFSTIYSLIEINKQAIERVEKSIETLPVIAALEDTDEYLNKYLPFKIQNMIDDTLMNVLNNTEANKLLEYE